MLIFLTGLVLFLGIHSVAIVAPRWRDRQVVTREGLWKGAYSLISAVGLGLLIYGFGSARQTAAVLWSPPSGLRHLALLVMLPVFPLFLATYLPGRIQRIARHPTLLAVIFWAAAHLLANGTTADVLLFGGFLVWAVLDRIAVAARRVPRHLPGASAGRFNDVIAVVGGLVIYVAMVGGLHRWLFGVSPLG